MDGNLWCNSNTYILNLGLNNFWILILYCFVLMKQNNIYNSHKFIAFNNFHVLVNVYPIL